MNAFVNEAVSITFEHLIDGEYASFDVGQTSYSVFDNSGTTIPGYQNVVIPTVVDQNQITVELPAAVQTIGTGKLFEQRKVVLRTKFAGKLHYLQESYYVTPHWNYTVNENDVVVLMGIREGEVLYPDIDLTAAYIQVVSAVGASAAATSLASGDIRQVKINDAIKAQAALALLRTIELRALKKLGSDSLSYTRFDGIDFNALRKNLTGMLQTAVLDAQNVSSSPVTAFSVTAPIDPITGA